MVFGNGRPTARADRRAPTMPWSGSSPRSFRSPRGNPLLLRSAERTARVRALVHQGRHPSRGPRAIHRPAPAEHAIAEDLTGVWIPVSIPEALTRARAE